MSELTARLRALASQENCDGEPYDTMIEAADVLQQYEADVENSMALIRSRGVTEQRAKRLPTALDVLLTRLDRLIQSQSHALGMIEQRVLIRTGDMPSGADLWFKDVRGCHYLAHHVDDIGALYGSIIGSAPDFRPDHRGPIALGIVNPAEG